MYRAAHKAVIPIPISLNAPERSPDRHDQPALSTDDNHVLEVPNNCSGVAVVHSGDALRLLAFVCCSNGRQIHYSHLWTGDLSIKT